MKARAVSERVRLEDVDDALLEVVAILVVQVVRLALVLLAGGVDNRAPLAID